MENKGNPETLILPAPAHFGIVTRDIEKSIQNFQRYYGIEFLERKVPDYFNKRYYGKPEDFKIELAFARVGNTVYELIQVLQGKTVYEDFMNEHGEGIHHLGYEIQNLAMWAKAYTKIGIKPIMSGQREGIKWVYFDTPVIVVELLERTMIEQGCLR